MFQPAVCLSCLLGTICIWSSSNMFGVFSVKCREIYTKKCSNHCPINSPLKSVAVFFQSIVCQLQYFDDRCQLSCLCSHLLSSFHKALFWMIAFHFCCLSKRPWVSPKYLWRLLMLTVPFKYSHDKTLFPVFYFISLSIYLYTWICSMGFLPWVQDKMTNVSVCYKWSLGVVLSLSKQLFEGKNLIH